ncbi:MAG TPA: tetratricopeptide repeat protein [Longimicrobiaceae bacterium]|nr:tetratricopeptide repeat protein [Longimicrobiaceae bacterium]
MFWQAFQDAELWARAQDRTGLFRRGSRVQRRREMESLETETYEAAKPHLSVLIRLSERPTTITAEAVRTACAELAIWFENRGLLRCAVEFALVASFAAPDEAALVIRVARLVRMLGEFPRSISWFDYGLYIARRSEDWQQAAKALTGLGILFYQKGNYPRARRYQKRCINLAKSKGLPDMMGEAFHNLFVLEMDAGNVELAENYAARAFKAYTPESPCLKRLARDLSHKLAVLGDYDRALPVALETLHHFTTPVDRALVWATVGLAAGGARDFATYEEAWIQMWALVLARTVTPVAAVVLLDLARGAAAMGDTRRAIYSASRALEFARERGEGHTSLEAEAFVSALEKEDSAPTNSTMPTAQANLPGVELDLLTALQHLRAVAA